MMERAELASLVPIVVVLITLMDLADGTVTFTVPSHSWWALTLFFGTSLAALFLALETSPRNPVTHMNSTFLTRIGYILAGSVSASLVRSTLRHHLDVDTVLEIFPVTLLGVSALVVTVNLLARLLRPQKG